MKSIWAIFRFVALLAVLFFPQLASAGELAPKAETRVGVVDIVVQTSLLAMVGGQFPSGAMAGLSISWRTMALRNRKPY